MNNQTLRYADSSHPLAIFILIDLSSHTFDNTHIRGMTRLQFIHQTINNIIETSLNRCRRGPSILPRHHLSFIGYNSVAFDIRLSDHYVMNDQQFAQANIADNIYPIDKFYNISMSFSPYRTNQSFSPYRTNQHTRNTAAAFRYVTHRIARNISRYQKSHPPIVIHFSSGLPHDIEELEAAFSMLTNQSTDCGTILVHSVFVGEHLGGIDQYDWQGITDRTMFSTSDAQAAYTLLATTSRIPPMYQSVIRTCFKAQLFSTDYLFIPGMVDTNNYWDAFLIGNHSYLRSHG